MILRIREEPPFDASTLVLFRKRISAEMLMEVNEYLLAHKDGGDNNNTPPSAGNHGNSDASGEDTNKGTLTLDATCVPANIRYSQDISLPNEAIAYNLPLPRRYNKRARKDYLAFAKSKKHSAKKLICILLFVPD